MLLLQLVIGAILVCITVTIHAVALDHLMTMNKNLRNSIRLRFGKFWKVPMLIICVLGTFSAHVVQIWVWALFYLLIGAFSNVTDALYFSTTAFTTVGFGDVVLNHDWRLISSFQAANGFMLFGWSTAFIFEIMSRLYESDTENQ